MKTTNTTFYKWFIFDKLTFEKIFKKEDLSNKPAETHYASIYGNAKFTLIEEYTQENGKKSGVKYFAEIDNEYLFGRPEEKRREQKIPYSRMEFEFFKKKIQVASFWSNFREKKEKYFFSRICHELTLVQDNHSFFARLDEFKGKLSGFYALKVSTPDPDAMAFDASKYFKQSSFEETILRGLDFFKLLETKKKHAKLQKMIAKKTRKK